MTKNNKNEIVDAKIVGDNIIISIPIDILVFAQENQPEWPSKIIDKNEMAEWFVRNILNYGEEDQKDSDFYELIDNMFLNAQESGVYWLEPIDWKEQE